MPLPHLIFMVISWADFQLDAHHLFPQKHVVDPVAGWRGNATFSQSCYWYSISSKEKVTSLISYYFVCIVACKFMVPWNDLHKHANLWFREMTCISKHNFSVHKRLLWPQGYVRDVCTSFVVLSFVVWPSPNLFFDTSMWFSVKLNPDRS
jgi:hypothetical protein